MYDAYEAGPTVIEPEGPLPTHRQMQRFETCMGMRDWRREAGWEPHDARIVL